jgi:hypothetical protein
MTEIVPAQRCCSSHTDWPQLTQHLVESFPDLPLVDIVGIVNRNRHAQGEFGPPPEQQLATAEIVIRHELTQLAGTNGTPTSLPTAQYGDDAHRRYGRFRRSG